MDDNTKLVLASIIMPSLALVYALDETIDPQMT
jgi:hypothetical protein